MTLLNKANKTLHAIGTMPKKIALPLLFTAIAIPATAQLLDGPAANFPTSTSPVTAEAAPAAPMSTGERIPELDRHFEQVAAITARFDQQLIDEDGYLLEEASGDMQLKRPGLFRWDYTEPYYQQIGSDGATLWIFDQELEQITLRPVAEGLGRTPAVLLSGEGSLYDQFVVTRAGTERDLEWLLLLPREQDTDFKRIRLGFNGDDLMSMELTDSLDQLTRITFSELSRNPDISRDNFILRIPDGTEVVGERG